MRKEVEDVLNVIDMLILKWLALVKKEERKEGIKFLKEKLEEYEKGV